MQLLGFEHYRRPAGRLAEALGIAYQEPEVHRFPDGEHRLRVPLPVQATVLLCCTLYDPNAKLIDLMLASRTLRELGAEKLILIAPYMCYMRQDKAFHPGESVSQKIVGEFLAGLFDVVVTVDPHMHRTPRLADAIPARQAISLSAAALIAERLQDDPGGWLLVGPDEESEQWVAGIAGLSGNPYLIGRKTRSGDRKVSIEFPRGEVRGQRIALIDDVISTGNTLAVAARHLLNQGAAEVQCFATHLLPHAGGLATLAEAGVSRVVCSDSIEHAGESFSLAPLLAEQVRRLAG